MDRKLEQELSQLVDRLDGTAAELGSRLPQAVDQLLTWHLVSATAWSLLALAVAAGLVPWIIRGLVHRRREAMEQTGDTFRGGNAFWDNRGEPEELGVLAWIIVSIILSVALVTLAANLAIIGQILVAPDVYALEYARQLAD